MVLFFWMTLASVAAWGGDSMASRLPRGAELVGMAQSEGMDNPMDRQMRDGLDSLVTRLRQLPADAPILIESHYPATTKSGKEGRIRQAYTLAEQVQQYLSSRHNLRFDYYISVWENSDANADDRPKVRISTYPLDFFDN